MTAFIKKTARFGALALVTALAAGCAADAEEEVVDDQSGATVESGTEKKMADIQREVMESLLTIRQDMTFVTREIKIGETLDGAKPTKCVLFYNQGNFERSWELKIPKGAVYRVHASAVYRNEDGSTPYWFNIGIVNHSTNPGTNPGFGLSCSKADSYPSAAAIRTILKNRFGFTPPPKR